MPGRQVRPGVDPDDKSYAIIRALMALGDIYPMPCKDNVTEHIKHLANVTSDDPIPETVEEAIVALEKLLTDEDKAFLDNAISQEKAAIQLHHSLGRHLRNSWGLWKGSRLYDHLFREHQIEHPDDMSHFLIVEFCRRHVKSVWERLDEA